MGLKLKLMVLVSLLGLSAIAFTPYLPFFGPSTVPATTPLTLGAALWVEPSRTGGYVTNGSTATGVNFGTAGSVYDLTNQVAAASPTLRAGMNGLSALAFPLGIYLVNARYLTTTRTQEVFFVWACTNTGATTTFTSFTAPASNHAVLTGGGLLQIQMSGTTANLTTVPPENKFYVLDVLYTGLNSTGFTNGVQGNPTFNLTSTNMNGIILGNTHAMSLLCMFSFPDRILTTADRLAAYQYCTNRFGQMP